MKRRFITYTLGIILTISSTAFITVSDNGIQGYAGSPGEGTCSNCHGGGFSANAGINVNSLPAFAINNNGDLEYKPDSVYQINVEVTASGFSHFGFASQILNSSLVNAGTLQAASSGVKFLNAASRRSAVHTTPKISASNTVTFSFQWKAPNQGDATIYAIGNAVNNNGSTSGDFVISPVSIALVAAPVPVDTTLTTGVREHQHPGLGTMSLFPNPCKDLCQLQYHVSNDSRVHVAIYDLFGRVLWQQERWVMAGLHLEHLNLNTIPSGSYLVRVSTANRSLSQKLLVQP